MSGEITYTPIGDINRETRRFANVKGQVIYTSGIEHWISGNEESHKMAFDVADSTGKIRVFVWREAADAVDQLIRRGQTVELRNVSVNPLMPRYNNLNHPFELELRSVEQMNILENDPIQVIEEAAVSSPYEEVRSKEHPQFTYFDVSGEIVRIEELRDGYGEPKGKNDTLRQVDMQDENGDVLHVASWNEYIPRAKLAIGKTLRINRGKFIRKHDELNSSGAQIEIDGERII